MLKNKETCKLIFVLLSIVCVLNTTSYAKSNICSDKKVLYGTLIKHIAKLRDNQKYDQGEKCLENVLKSKPHKDNSEFKKIYLNFLIWQRKFNKASLKVQILNDKPFQKALVVGDIAWVQGDFKKAYKEYSKVVLSKGLPFLSPIYTRKYILSKVKSVGVQKSKEDYNLALSVYPKSKIILDLNNIFRNKKVFSASSNIGAKTYNVENDLNISEYDFAFKYKRVNYFLGLKIKNIKRSYSGVDFTDNIMGLNVGVPIDLYTIVGTFNHTLSPDFSYKDMYSIDVSRKLYDKFVLGVNGQRRVYINETSNIYSLYIEAYLKDIYVRTSLGFELESFYIKGRGNLFKEVLYGTIWYASGKTDSGNTFDNKNDFSAYGLGASFGRLNSINFEINYEKHIERGFDYSAYSLKGNFHF